MKTFFTFILWTVYLLGAIWYYNHLTTIWVKNGNELDNGKRLESVGMSALWPICLPIEIVMFWRQRVDQIRNQKYDRKAEGR